MKATYLSYSIFVVSILINIGYAVAVLGSEESQSSSRSPSRQPSPREKSTAQSTLQVSQKSQSRSPAHSPHSSPVGSNHSNDDGKSANSQQIKQTSNTKSLSGSPSPKHKRKRTQSFESSSSSEGTPNPTYSPEHRRTQNLSPSPEPRRPLPFSSRNRNWAEGNRNRYDFGSPSPSPSPSPSSSGRSSTQLSSERSSSRSLTHSLPEIRQKFSKGVETNQDYLRRMGSANIGTGLALMGTGVISTVAHPIAGVYAGGRTVLKSVKTGVVEGCKSFIDGVCKVSKGFGQVKSSYDPQKAREMTSSQPKRKYYDWEDQSGRKAEKIAGNTLRKISRQGEAILETATGATPAKKRRRTRY